MSNPDWLPTREQDLVELAVVWDALLSDAAKQTAFGWNAAKCASVVLKIGAFIEKRNAYLEEKTKPKRLTKIIALKALKKAMRKFTNDAIRFNDLMSLEDKLVMGIGPRDENKTAQGDPDRPPTFSVRPRDTCQLALRISAEGSSRVAIPVWAAGAVVLLQVGGTPPASAEDLPVIRLITRARYVLNFAAGDSGKTAYLSVQWQNSTGEKGPPALIKTLIIP
jgi:hypothetical protein